MTYMPPPFVPRPFGNWPLQVALRQGIAARGPKPVRRGQALFLLAICVTAVIVMTGQGSQWIELVWLSTAIGLLSLNPSFRKERLIAAMAQGSVLVTSALALAETAPMVLGALLAVGALFWGWGWGLGGKRHPSRHRGPSLPD